MNKYNIIMALARTNSAKRNDTERLKLISSVTKYYGEINTYELKVNVENLIQKTEFFNDNKFIVIELFHWDDRVDYENYERVIETPQFKYIRLNILVLLQNLWLEYNNSARTEAFQLFFDRIKRIRNYDDYVSATFDYSLKTGRDILVGNIFENKNFNKYNNIIFIFNNIPYKNCLLLLKTAGISIHGGIGTRRHILSTVQASLTSFLLLLNNFKIDYNQIYKNFSDSDIREKDFNEVKFSEIINLDFSNRNDEEINYIKDMKMIISSWILINDYRRTINDHLNSINYNYKELNKLKSEDSNVKTYKLKLIEEIYYLEDWLHYCTDILSELLGKEVFRKTFLNSNIFKFLEDLDKTIQIDFNNPSNIKFLNNIIVEIFKKYPDIHEAVKNKMVKSNTEQPFNKISISPFNVRIIKGKMVLFKMDKK